MAEVAVLRALFGRILDMIDDLRPREPAPWQRQKAVAPGRRQAKYARTGARTARSELLGCGKAFRATILLRRRLSRRACYLPKGPSPG